LAWVSYSTILWSQISLKSLNSSSWCSSISNFFKN
jgi:hypothetical protein